MAFLCLVFVLVCGGGGSGGEYFMLPIYPSPCYSIVVPAATEAALSNERKLSAKSRTTNTLMMQRHARANAASTHKPNMPEHGQLIITIVMYMYLYENLSDAAAH